MTEGQSARGAPASVVCFPFVIKSVKGLHHSVYLTTGAPLSVVNVGKQGSMLHDACQLCCHATEDTQIVTVLSAVPNWLLF